MILSCIAAIIIFGILIIIHELGHFLAAKRFGVGTNEFSIGFGPKLFSKTAKDGTLVSLRALPLGGYVSLVGEDEESERRDAIGKKPLLQRFVVMAAGSVMNLLFGFLIMSLLVCFSGALYSNTVEKLYFVNENGEYLEEYDGLRNGDTILSINGNRLHVQYDYIYTAMRLGNEKCTLEVLRDGEKVVIDDFDFPTFSENGTVFGDPVFFLPKPLKKTVGTVIRESFYRSCATVKLIWTSLFDLITGRYGMEAVSGPVGIVGEIHETASYGIEALIFLAAMISINLGVMNLLPFPALDGGRLVFLLVELIRGGKKIKPEHEGLIHLAGMALLMLFTVFVTYKDIVGLIAG